MRKINNKLVEHINSSVTTLATCWYIKLQNGTTLGFTDHDQNIILDNFTYQAASGFNGSSIESKYSLAVDNLEIRAVLDNNLIKRQDLLDGLYDMAEILVLKVNYLDLSHGVIILHRGWIGEITVKDNKFFAEVRGIAQKTATNIGEVYSETCRAEFGDAKCKVDLSQFTFEAKVDQVRNGSSFFSGILEKHGQKFSYGQGEFIDGANKGLKFQVKESFQGNIKIVLPLPHPIEEQDQFIITYGCNKRFDTCSKKYENFLNFRGEPHIPEL